MMNEYEYKAVLIKVVDGDTVDLGVHLGEPEDLGFDVVTVPPMIRVRFRLWGINASESRTRGLEKKASKKWLKERLKSLDQQFKIRTIKDKKGKFGRYLVELLDTKNGININNQMVELGLAVHYMRNKK
jgi:micrococcal nuclease